VNPSPAKVPDVSIVIVTYNSANVIGACLASIPSSEVNVETIMVDNGSTDGTVDLVREKFPGVQIVTGQGNVGFARANNIGFRLSHGRYLLTLNADTEIRPGALRTLVDFADAHPEAAIVAPRLVNPDGTLQHSTFRFPDYRQAFFGFFEKLVPLDSVPNGRYPPQDYERVRPVEHTLGAAILARRQVWEQTRGMDEKYGLYFEETDWCYRAKRAGWQLFYIPTAIIVHLGAHSTKRNPERSSALFAQSQAYFYRKNYGLLSYLGLKVITIIGLTYWLARTVLGLGRGRITRETFARRIASYLQILVA